MMLYDEHQVIAPTVQLLRNQPTLPEGMVMVVYAGWLHDFSFKHQPVSCMWSIYRRFMWLSNWDLHLSLRLSNLHQPFSWHGHVKFTFNAQLSQDTSNPNSGTTIQFWRRWLEASGSRKKRAWLHFHRCWSSQLNVAIWKQLQTQSAALRTITGCHLIWQDKTTFRKKVYEYNFMLCFMSCWTICRRSRSSTVLQTEYSSHSKRRIKP